MIKPGVLPRKAAWEVLQAVSAGAYADVALNRIIKKYSLKGTDRSLTTEIAYGSIRLRNLLDCWIDHLGKIPSRKQPPLLRLLLHIGIYQLLEMKRIPASAAINTTVEIAKTSYLIKLAPVTNGLLRAINRKLILGETLPTPINLYDRIAQDYSLPLWLSKGIVSWLGDKGAENFLNASNKVPSFDLRINRLRSNPKSLQKELSSAGVKTLLLEDFPDALKVESGLGDLQEWPGYNDGKWCVQDRSSQWVSTLLEPCKGDRILDACSAPGTKTTHIAELIGNNGEVWAVDRSESRLRLVSQNVARLGANCVNVLVADSSNLLAIKPKWKGSFQRILLDAPCSGLGTLSRNSDARWRITQNKINELVNLQEKLLKGILPLLCSGGRLVYSTCTIHPEENQRQIDKFILSHPNIKLIHQKQIIPSINKDGDGFYAAVLELT